VRPHFSVSIQRLHGPIGAYIGYIADFPLKLMTIQQISLSFRPNITLNLCSFIAYW